MNLVINKLTKDRAKNFGGFSKAISARKVFTRVMSTQITITLLEEVYKRAERFLRLTKRNVVSILSTMKKT